MMDLTGFDLNLLRVFVAIAKERSVTRAGEQIAMSQPAVSAALNRLRYVLDDQLFVRRGNDMVPTPYAEALIGPVQDALDRLQAALQIKRQFDPAAVTRVYTLVGADYFSLLLMPVLSSRFAKHAPGIRLRVLDSGRTDNARMLLDDAADVVLEGPLEMPEWVSREVLFRSEFTIVAKKDHPKLLRLGVKPGDVMPLDLFCELPHALRTIEGGLTGFTDAALEKIGRSRRVILTLPHFHGVLLAVARGELIAALPARFAKVFAPALDVGLYKPPIEIPVPEIQMYWHSRRDRDPAHGWLRRQIIEALGEVSR